MAMIACHTLWTNRVPAVAPCRPARTSARRPSTRLRTPRQQREPSHKKSYAKGGGLGCRATFERRIARVAVNRGTPCKSRAVHRRKTRRNALRASAWLSGRQGFSYRKRLPRRAESRMGKRRHESSVFRRRSEALRILLTRISARDYYRTLGHGSLPHWLRRSLWR